MGKKLGLDKSYNALKITLGKYPLTSINLKIHLQESFYEQSIKIKHTNNSSV